MGQGWFCRNASSLVGVIQYCIVVDELDNVLSRPIVGSEKYFGCLLPKHSLVASLEIAEQFYRCPTEPIEALVIITNHGEGAATCLGELEVEALLK